MKRLMPREALLSMLGLVNRAPGKRTRREVMPHVGKKEIARHDARLRKA
jgi:hypothetical protein